MKPILEQQVGADFMIHDGEDDSVHVLNPVARLIFDLHRKGVPEEDLAGELRSRFEIPPGQDLEEDIRTTLAALADKGLL